MAEWKVTFPPFSCSPRCTSLANGQSVHGPDCGQADLVSVQALRVLCLALWSRFDELSPPRTQSQSLGKGAAAELLAVGAGAGEWQLLQDGGDGSIFLGRETEELVRLSVRDGLERVGRRGDQQSLG